MLSWATIPCPVLGDFRKVALEIASQQSEPWRNRIVQLIEEDCGASAKTILVLAFCDGCAAASVWLSLPDLSVFTGELRSAFIAGVYVAERFRGRHLATDAVERAC